MYLSDRCVVLLQCANWFQIPLFDSRQASVACISDLFLTWFRTKYVDIKKWMLFALGCLWDVFLHEVFSPVDLGLYINLNIYMDTYLPCLVTDVYSCDKWEVWCMSSMEIWIKMNQSNAWSEYDSDVFDHWVPGAAAVAVQQRCMVETLWPEVLQGTLGTH